MKDLLNLVTVIQALSSKPKIAMSPTCFSVLFFRSADLSEQWAREGRPGAGQERG